MSKKEDNEEDFEYKYTKNEVKNKLMAGMLGIFGGVIGMHKFYLNQNSLGLLYSILSLIFVIATGLLVQLTENKAFLFLAAVPYAIALYSIYEGIMLIRMKDEVFNAKYNKSEPNLE